MQFTIEKHGPAGCEEATQTMDHGDMAWAKAAGAAEKEDGVAWAKAARAEEEDDNTPLPSDSRYKCRDEN